MYTVGIQTLNDRMLATYLLDKAGPQFMYLVEISFFALMMLQI